MAYQTCDILLYKGTGFVSKLIKWKTSSPYSHVSVIVGAETNLAIESNTGSQSGVRAVDIRKVKAEDIDIFRVKAGKVFAAEKVISYLVDSLGSKYDIPGVFWLGIMKVFNLKEKANQFQKDKDYFCSELVYEAFNSAGLDIVPEVGEADITSPGDIARSSVLQKIN